VDVVLLALADVVWRGPQPELEALFALLDEDGAVIETIMPPLVKAVFGLPLAGNDRKDRRPTEELAAAILTLLGHQVRVVHGSFDCLHGTFGSGSRFAYCTQIPGFGEMIRALFTLEPGTVEKIAAPLR
jgi:hypothetical protein